jgi:MATE family multidrug resistance protein
VSNIKFIFNKKLGKSMILEFFSDRIMDNSMEERLLSPEELNSSDLKRRVWNESKKLWVIAFPGMVARVSSFGMIIVTQLFMGHISELDLAAYGLQQSILLRFVDGILVRPPLNILLL